MQRTLEQPRIFYMFVIATVFWVYITWYTSRIIGKITYASLSRRPGKEERFLGTLSHPDAKVSLFHLFNGYHPWPSVKLEKDPENKYDYLFFLVLVFSSFYYFRLYRFWCNRADAVDKLTTLKSKKNYFKPFVHPCKCISFYSLIIDHFLPILSINGFPDYSSRCIPGRSCAVTCIPEKIYLYKISG
jgi:hypothetical protein